MKNKLEELYDLLNDLSTGIHISNEQSLLSAYTMVVEDLNKHQVVVRQVLYKIDRLMMELNQNKDKDV